MTKMTTRNQLTEKMTLTVSPGLTEGEDLGVGSPDLSADWISTTILTAPPEQKTKDFLLCHAHFKYPTTLSISSEMASHLFFLLLLLRSCTGVERPAAAATAAVLLVSWAAVEGAEAETEGANLQLSIIDRDCPVTGAAPQE